MAKLAIIGHATRGKEVIKLLEMLGGKNDNLCSGGFVNSIYFINNYGYIESCSSMQHLDYLQMTLEEFEEMYPYKVGDRVIIKNTNQEVIVNKVAWCVDTIIYWLDYCGNLSGNYTADALQHYKEETMKENLEQITLDIPDGYEFFGINDDNKVVLTKKQVKYPKTYEECCDVLKIEYPYFKTEEDGISASTYKNKLVGALKKLLICRDAYWKIADDWKPEYGDVTEIFYTISYDGVDIRCYNDTEVYSILAFPTKEMRDAFYENFKDLVEECKELL